MGWALPVAIVGGIFLLKEIKSIKIPSFPEWPDMPDIIIQPKTIDELLAERTAELQGYEAERVVDAQRIESERAAEQLSIGGSYGTVAAGGSAWTGQWFTTPGKAGDSCHVLYASSAGSNTTRYFTGAHCRQARAQGLIP